MKKVLKIVFAGTPEFAAIGKPSIPTQEEIRKMGETHFYQNNNKGIYNSGTEKEVHIETYFEGYQQALKDLGHLN